LISAGNLTVDDVIVAVAIAQGYPCREMIDSRRRKRRKRSRADAPW
jgi:hypothetical protein